ncbi:MAG: hypothetical protein EOO11_13850, partial [Chitinophagaceae bacterium]
MKLLLSAAAGLLLLASCSKVLDQIVEKATEAPAADGPVDYVIEAGAHSALQSGLRAVSLTEQAFLVRFDSSAIYT